jgi:uncharacterized protein
LSGALAATVRGRPLAARLVAAAWLALMTMVLAGPASAELSFPALTGRVVDEAGIIDAARHATIAQQLAELEAKTTDQVVVVTLTSLQGTTIEEFGVRLGRHWQIGQKGKNNGALLIVAPTERKVRIEVGYGLESVLTDAVTRTIIDVAIRPKFRAGDFPGGIAAGVDAILNVLTHDDSEWKARAAATPEQDAWIPLLFFALVVVFIIIVFVQTIRGGPRHRGGNFVIGPGSSGWSSSSGGSSDGGFSGGGGSFGGGGSSGDW